MVTGNRRFVNLNKGHLQGNGPFGTGEDTANTQTARQFQKRG
jgi:hypothetical protein